MRRKKTENKFNRIQDPFIRKMMLFYGLNFLQSSKVFLDNEQLNLLEELCPEKVSPFIEIDEYEDEDDWPQSIEEVNKDLLERSLLKFFNDYKSATSELETRLCELQKTFRLSDNECACLLVLYLKKNCSFCDELSDTLCGFRSSLEEKITCLSAFTNLSRSQVKQAMSRESNLQNSGIIDEDLDLEDRCELYLSGLEDSSLGSMYYREYSGEVIDLDFHKSLKKEASLICDLLQQSTKENPCRILLYGKPGTGKTEFARSLAAEVGRQLFVINNGEEDSSARGRLSRSRGNCYTALYACERAVDLDKSLIMIDEADNMLNGETSGFGFLFGGRSENKDKGKLNLMLDRSNSSQVWITNSIDGMDDSSKRRFDYSVRFEDFSQQQRQMMWQLILDKKGMTCFSSEQLNRLSEHYKINAGGIELALRNLEKLDPNFENAEKVIDDFLQPHKVLLTGHKEEKKLDAVANYSLEGLNIKTERPLAETLDLLQSFCEYQSENEEGEVRNMNLLLHGPPGTGKTEFVRYMAKQLGKKLVSRNATEMMDCYVGGTEANIRRAFAEAERENAVLFFDEVDGLLASRDKARNSWEVTQVNALLSCMENFRGIFISATNFSKNLDPASLRRFNLKVEFDYLNQEGRVHFYKLLLGQFSKEELSLDDEQQLKQLEKLTVGDFKIVRQQNLFLAGKGIDHSRLIQSLKEEVALKKVEKNHSIGF